MKKILLIGLFFLLVVPMHYTTAGTKGNAIKSDSIEHKKSRLARLIDNTSDLIETVNDDLSIDTIRVHRLGLTAVNGDNGLIIDIKK